MGARTEVEGDIYKNWIDQKVAEWVIKNLPLLEYAYKNDPCPIYELRLDSNPVLPETPKLVISGGFEGTKGHIAAIKDVWEYKALTQNPNTVVTLMLEQDSYIINCKKRNPLVPLKQRIELWSTSGLVDFVFVLPNRPEDMSPSEFYEKINQMISPATWCVNIENRNWQEVMYRGQTRKIIDASRLFAVRPSIHTSFLSSTKNMDTQGVIERLRDYALEYVMAYENTEILSVNELVDIKFKEISKGL